MEWFTKHADTIVILSSFAICFYTLNEKISIIEKDLTTIKTVLILRNIMPAELAQHEGEK